MFSGDLYLLVEEHNRELREAAGQGRLERTFARRSDEVMRRRAAAKLKLLRTGIRRG